MAALRRAGIKSLVTSHVNIPNNPATGTDAFVGDHMLGWVKIKNFADADLLSMPQWMHDAAMAQYPNKYPPK